MTEANQFAVVTRYDSETRTFREFATLAAAKKFGAEQIKSGWRVNNATIHMPDYAPALHASMTNGRVHWSASKF